MSRKKASKVKLAPYESELLNNGLLTNITHQGSNSIWLQASSTCNQLMKEGGEEEETQKKSLVYRPMGDKEVSYLIQNGKLPSTQPYQAIIEGERGRIYAEKYLRGFKKVDSEPTTVIEFNSPTELIDQLFQIQHKVEDGALSMGLGNKGGNGRE